MSDMTTTEPVHYIYDTKACKAVKVQHLGPDNEGMAQIMYLAGRKKETYGSVLPFLLFASVEALQAAIGAGVIAYRADQRRAEVREVLYNVGSGTYRATEGEPFDSDWQCRYGVRLKATSEEATVWLRKQLAKAVEIAAEQVARRQEGLREAERELEEARRALAKLDGENAKSPATPKKGGRAKKGKAVS